MSTFTTEMPLVVWNDGTGARIEVGPDRDGLDLIEIRQYDEQGKIGSRLTITVEEWDLLRTYEAPGA